MAKRFLQLNKIPLDLLRSAWYPWDMKNKHAVILGRKGGKVKSEAKTRAAKENIKKRWKKGEPSHEPQK